MADSVDRVTFLRGGEEFSIDRERLAELVSEAFRLLEKETTAALVPRRQLMSAQLIALELIARAPGGMGQTKSRRKAPRDSSESPEMPDVSMAADRLVVTRRVSLTEGLGLAASQLGGRIIKSRFTSPLSVEALIQLPVGFIVVTGTSPESLEGTAREDAIYAAIRKKIEHRLKESLFSQYCRTMESLFSQYCRTMVLFLQLRADAGGSLSQEDESKALKKLDNIWRHMSNEEQELAESVWGERS